MSLLLLKRFLSFFTTLFQMVNIPLSDKCIEILIQKLDVDGDGEIDFGLVLSIDFAYNELSCVVRKPVFGVSDQV